MMLFNLWEKSYYVNVDDINLYKNAKAFTDIYVKQTYRNILSVIDNILTDDRDRKALTDSDGKYYLDDAYISGETLVASSSKVPNPVYIKYGFGKSPFVNILNKLHYNLI